MEFFRTEKGTGHIGLSLSFYASNESKSVLARDLDDCRESFHRIR